MVDEIRIHSGTQVRLRGLRDDELPASFLQNLQELARRERQVEAVYLFGMQPEDEEERVAMVLALRGGIFSNKSEEFLRLVNTIGQLLPSDLSINVYRFGASQLIAGYCLQTLDPVFLRSPNWVEKQRRRFDD